ncbi:MAG: DUF5671 domain-containing protein [Chloroflexota bacterium]|nr:DUF5671 domain-containing protein [Chloroflexota bacterium]
MTVVRRLYQYGIAFVSLIMLAIGLQGLGRIFVDVLVPPTGGDGTGLITNTRSDVTQYAALVLVGLPVWLLHWVMAGRTVAREPDERGAALRRLYVYAVLAVMAVRWAVSAHGFLSTAGRALAGGIVADAADSPTLRGLLSHLPWLIVSALVWAYHRRVAVVDRNLAGEAGGSATLRRWYRYGIALIGLLLLLNGASALLRLTWENVASTLVQTVIRMDAGAVSSPVATALVGLALWLSHWSDRATGPATAALRRQMGEPGGVRPGGNASEIGRSAGPVASPLDGVPGVADALSVLRPVYMFLALGISVAVALGAAAQMLFYALGRVLGVAQPGGVGGSLAVAMAGPASTFLIFGLSWLYHRRAVAAQAHDQPELPRQVGVRRIYTYLVAVIALSVLATGAGGLLWTLADAATNAPQTISRDDWWPEQVSLYVTLLVVGLPVWLLHWGPVSGPTSTRWTTPEPLALARRLYLYLTLLIGVLALLGSGATAAKQLLDLALGESATAGVLTTLGRAGAVAAVSGLIVFYHQRVLRADATIASSIAETRPAASAAASGPAAPAVNYGLAGSAALARGAGVPSAAQPFGLVYRRSAVETSEWFSTAAAARSALLSLSSASQEGPGAHSGSRDLGGTKSRLSTQDAVKDVEWVALVKLEDGPEAPPPPSLSEATPQHQPPG